MMDGVERESMEYDVVIVGGGPAGLSAAIRLKQINEDLAVCLVEKGSEVGAHILSGAVIDPVGLNRLFPDWRERGAPLRSEVKEDQFYVLGHNGDLRVPNILIPPLMNNHGNYIVSLGEVSRWLAEQAEALGVEIYPGMAASAPVYGEQGELVGVVAGEYGLGPDGAPGPEYQPGMELRGKYVLIAEGARGSLAKVLTAKYGLQEGRDPQKYGIGMKELWEVKPENFHQGRVTHTMGWPLDMRTGGGSFCYHFEKNQVYVGFVVHLNYANPYLAPYEEFQRFKHHDLIRPLLEGGKRVAYGARAITEGGWQSIPKLAFPGGALIGCTAGLVNVPRIKGSHNAMLSGQFAAEAAAAALAEGRSGDELTAYVEAVTGKGSPIRKDLYRVRNVKPLWSKLGLVGGVGLAAADMWLNQIFGTSPFTLKHGENDAEATEPAAKHKPIAYPKPDGKISFDRLTSVSFSFTNHDEHEKPHLVLTDPSIPIKVNLPLYAEPAQRYCPAGVYEVVGADTPEPRFVVNFQNCVHCKTCDIKDPSQNITWTTPQGGEGPNYPNM